MTDFIVMAVLVLIIGGAVLYIKRAKKKGANCIGCPSGGKCSGKGQGESACSCGCNIDCK